MGCRDLPGGPGPGLLQDHSSPFGQADAGAFTSKESNVLRSTAHSILIWMCYSCGRNLQGHPDFRRLWRRSVIRRAVCRSGCRSLGRILRIARRSPLLNSWSGSSVVLCRPRVMRGNGIRGVRCPCEKRIAERLGRPLGVSCCVSTVLGRRPVCCRSLQNFVRRTADQRATTGPHTRPRDAPVHTGRRSSHDLRART